MSMTIFQYRPHSASSNIFFHTQHILILFTFVTNPKQRWGWSTTNTMLQMLHLYITKKFWLTIWEWINQLPQKSHAPNYPWSPKDKHRSRVSPWTVSGTSVTYILCSIIIRFQSNRFSHPAKSVCSLTIYQSFPWCIRSIEKINLPSAMLETESTAFLGMHALGGMHPERAEESCWPSPFFSLKKLLF